MKLSENGLKLLASDAYEGNILHVYKDAAGLPTIGVGHLLTATEKATGKININGKQVLIASGITEQQALDLLAQDVKPAEQIVNSQVKIPLSQNQFDALTIFTFNVGTGGFASSSALTDLNAKEIKKVPDDLRKWNKITKNGQHVVCDGLVKRRELEIALFEKV